VVIGRPSNLVRILCYCFIRYTSATLNVLRGMDTTDIDLDLVASLVSHIHLQKQVNSRKTQVYRYIFMYRT
jgi:hypothetical protein